MDEFHCISLGAGVQSSTMALMAAKGIITPMPQLAVFADTQGEPKSVYDWLEYLETELPFPVVRVTKGNLAEQELEIRVSKKSGKTYRKSAIPAFTSNGGMLLRKCTRDFKIYPIYSYIKKYFNITRNCKLPLVKSWIGISIDESHRMKPSPKKWCENIYPLIDLNISRQNCLEWMLKNGYPTPPRSACTFCPYHNDIEWLRLKTEEPEEFNKAVILEQKLQEKNRLDEVAKQIPYLHVERKPLSEVNFEERIKNKRQTNNFGNECEGMCGV
jgi:hypothetical protein